MADPLVFCWVTMFESLVSFCSHSRVPLPLLSMLSEQIIFRFVIAFCVSHRKRLVTSAAAGNYHLEKDISVKCVDKKDEGKPRTAARDHQTQKRCNRKKSRGSAITLDWEITTITLPSCAGNGRFNVTRCLYQNQHDKISSLFFSLSSILPLRCNNMARPRSVLTLLTAELNSTQLNIVYRVFFFRAVATH